MNQQSIKIGKRSFILSLSVLLVLMILATVLAYVFLPVRSAGNRGWERAHCRRYISTGRKTE